MYLFFKTLLSFALAGHALGQDAMLYTTTSCDPGNAIATCRNLPELRCCQSLSMTRFLSSKIIAPVALYISSAARLGLQQNCLEIRSTIGTACIRTGAQDIEGAFWFSCMRSCSALASTALARGKSPEEAAMAAQLTQPPRECKGTQLADIYFFAFPGEDRKPYDIELIKKLMIIQAVDWDTATVKPDKIKEVRTVIAEHGGDGLNELQQASLELWRNEMKAFKEAKAPQ